jgi:hypothetical protein
MNVRAILRDNSPGTIASPAADLSRFWENWEIF